MDLIGWIKGLFGFGQMKLKALIAYPNKAIVIKNINAKDMRFTIGPRTYIVDEKAIYFHKKKPILIYHFNNASPLIFSDVETSASLNPGEVNAVIQSKIVQDLLKGAQEKDLLFYIVIAAAVLSLVNTLILSGVVKIGG